MGLLPSNKEIIPMETQDIYIACLASYTNGILYGRWISANQSAEDIENEIYEMLEDSPVEDAEEWAIHDYSGFSDINIGEYENLETVVEYADFISEHGDLGIALIAGYDFDEAKKMIEDDYHGVYDSEVEFAEQIVDECYGQLLPNNLAGYFDYQAFARDLFSYEYCSVRLDGNVHVFACY